MSAADRQAIETFLIHEARLLDDGRFEEWLALFDEDALYWLPAGQGEPDPAQYVSIIYDTKHELAQRVARLRSGHAHAQDPASTMLRMISNVTLQAAEGDAIRADCALALFVLSRHKQVIHGARCAFTLRAEGGSFRIRRKVATLVRAAEPLDGIPYLV